MNRQASAVTAAAATPPPGVPGGMLASIPRAGPREATAGAPAAGSAELVDYLAADHDRIAERINDVVVRRIFAAGLDLQAALGLIGDHRGTGKIYHAINELDQVIRDIRDIIFDDSPPDSLSCRRGGRARAVPALRGSGASPRH